MNCNEVREYLEAYALGILEPAERSAVEDHLATCVSCRQHIDELSEALNVLPMALAASSRLSPPEQLKDDLLSTVAAARGVTVSADALTGQTPRRRLLEFRPTESGLRWWVFANIAAVVLLLLSFTWGIRLVVALENERTLRSEHAALLERVIGDQEIVFEVIGFDDTNRQFLRAQQPDSTSYGKLFTRPSMPFVVVMAGRLPTPANGEAFYLWVTSGGQTSLAGQLTVDEYGFGLLVFETGAPGPSYDAAFVTLQQSGATEPGGLEILRS